MLGAAWQLGLVPLARPALMRAIELNGVEIERNKQAFDWGRAAVAAADRVLALAGRFDTAEESLDDAIARRRGFLVDYQDDRLAQRYDELVQRFVAAERELSSSVGNRRNLSRAAMRSYFKLLSYKDEYEVARLHAETGFVDSVRREFGADAKLRYHLAPPILSGGVDARGRPRKREFGAWILPVLKLLAKLRRLRGTAFDPFGRTAERRMERTLIVEFERQADRLLELLDHDNYDQVAAIVECWMDIRGYGPVKEAAVREVRERVASMLAALDAPREKAA